MLVLVFKALYDVQDYDALETKCCLVFLYQGLCNSSCFYYDLSTQTTWLFKLFE